MRDYSLLSLVIIDLAINFDMNLEEVPLVDNHRTKTYESITLNDNYNTAITLGNKKSGGCFNHCAFALRRFSNNCSNCIDWAYVGNTLYDVINILITTADIITDDYRCISCL